MSFRRLVFKMAAALSLGVSPVIGAAQQFQQTALVAAGSGSVGIVTADLNGDGKVDLVYTDDGATATSSTTHILLGNGDGTFTAGQTIATAGAAIAVADFDHDGHPDLEWVWGVAGEGKVFEARGNGDGTFAAPEELGTFAIGGTNAPQFGYVMGAQMHDTGRMDLLVEDMANLSLLALRSDSSGVQVRVVETKLQSGAGPMFTADLNGDGHMDLVIRPVSGGVADVLLGSAEGLPGGASADTESNSVQSYSAAQVATAVSTSVLLTITSPSSIYFGQAVTGYAKVTASNGSALAGTITFYDGAQSICVIPATQAAGCPVSAEMGFTAGTHVMKAVYSGDASHSGSASNAVTVTVLPDVTITSLVSSVSTAELGQSVTFTATVVGPYMTASGVVTFFDGSSVLGTGTLNSAGIASFSTVLLGAGSHTVTASYAGDVNTAASVSTEVMETVTGSGIAVRDGFSITVTGSAKVGVGRMAKMVVTIAPVQGYGQPVELSCADLPAEAACTFGVHTIPAGGGTTTLELSTIAPHDCGSTTPYFLSAGLPFAGPALVGVVMVFVPRKRRLQGLLIALVASCGMAALTGCGTCTDLGTRPGSYTVRVIGTATGTGANSSVAGVVAAKVKVNVTLE